MISYLASDFPLCSILCETSGMVLVDQEPAHFVERRFELLVSLYVSSKRVQSNQNAIEKPFPKFQVSRL